MSVPVEGSSCERVLTGLGHQLLQAAWRPCTGWAGAWRIPLWRGPMVMIAWDPVNGQAE